MPYEWNQEVSLSASRSAFVASSMPSVIGPYLRCGLVRCACGPIPSRPLCRSLRNRHHSPGTMLPIRRIGRWRSRISPPAGITGQLKDTFPEGTTEDYVHAIMVRHRSDGRLCSGLVYLYITSHDFHCFDPCKGLSSEVFTLWALYQF